jgi:hypothetical protein
LPKSHQSVPRYNSDYSADSLHHLFGDTMILYYMPFVKIYASIVLLFCDNVMLNLF